MNIPKRIQEKMHKTAQYAKKSRALAQEIDDYFINQGLDIDMLRCGNGISLDELDYGNDITEAFIKEAEEDFKSDDWQAF